jgi:hypothetical protein
VSSFTKIFSTVEIVKNHQIIRQKDSSFVNGENENPLRVQYGCGLDVASDWLNFDASPRLRVEKMLGWMMTSTLFPKLAMYGDIVRGLPIPQSSCSLLYCSHVLEHLTFEDMHTALENSYKVLREGGVFRLVVPDLRALSSAYMQDQRSDAANIFMRNSGLGKEANHRGVVGKLRDLFGNSQHLWLWDEPSLRIALEKVGFSQVRLANFHDSHFPEFKALEQADRWAGCLGIECIKPVHRTD